MECASLVSSCWVKPMQGRQLEQVSMATDVYRAPEMRHGAGERRFSIWDGGRGSCPAGAHWEGRDQALGWWDCPAPCPEPQLRDPGLLPKGEGVLASYKGLLHPRCISHAAQEGDGVPQGPGGPRPCCCSIPLPLQNTAGIKAPSHSSEEEDLQPRIRAAGG